MEVADKLVVYNNVINAVKHRKGTSPSGCKVMGGFLERVMLE